MEHQTYNKMQTSEESSGLLSETIKQQIQGVEYAAAVAPLRWFPKYKAFCGR
ncbi:MAG: hypothetical protein ABJA71_13240 [Ginsengibacter sp.]